jgi:hypothetical protein
MRQDERQCGEQQTSERRTAAILRSAFGSRSIAVASIALTASGALPNPKSGMVRPREAELDSHIPGAIRSNPRSDGACIAEVLNGNL